MKKSRFTEEQRYRFCEEVDRLPVVGAAKKH